MRRLRGPALAVVLACLCTSVAASPRRSDLDLYRDALFLLGGPTCYPVGLEGDRFERSANRLGERRQAVREALRLRLGSAAVESVEDEVQSVLDMTDYLGCTPAQAAETRRKLGWKLRALERRLGLSRRP